MSISLQMEHSMLMLDMVSVDIQLSGLGTPRGPCTLLWLPGRKNRCQMDAWRLAVNPPGCHSALVIYCSHNCNTDSRKFTGRVEL